MTCNADSQKCLCHCLKAILTKRLLRQSQSQSILGSLLGSQDMNWSIIGLLQVSHHGLMDRELSFRNEGQWFKSRPSMMVSREFEGALKTLSRSQARQPWWLVMPIHKNVYAIASKQYLQKAPTSESKPIHTGVSARKSRYELIFIQRHFILDSFIS